MNNKQQDTLAVKNLNVKQQIESLIKASYTVDAEHKKRLLSLACKLKTNDETSIADKVIQYFEQTTNNIAQARLNARRLAAEYVTAGIAYDKNNNTYFQDNSFI